MIVVPVNIDNELWCLAVADFEKRTIRYYDSTGGDGKIYLHAMRDYINKLHLAQERMPINFNWNLVPTSARKLQPHFR